MQQLIADHRNFAVFIDILEGQADRLEAGERTDLEVVEAILGYLHRYGDQCHHPREDLLYAQLRQRHPQASEGTSGLEADHAQMHEATKRLLHEVRTVCDGSELDAYALAQRLSGFVIHYRAHFDAENEHLFPIAIAVFTPEDWKLIERLAAIMTSAERAMHVQERFHALRNYIHAIDRLNP